jgi:hypothetical protein
MGPQYGILEWDGRHWEPELHIVTYDISRTRHAYVDSGYLREGGPLARAFLLSVETGRSVTWALHCHAMSTMKREGETDPSTAPEELWWRAVETFDWEAHLRR